MVPGLFLTVLVTCAIRKILQCPPLPTLRLQDPAARELLPLASHMIKCPGVCGTDGTTTITNWWLSP